MLRRSLKRALIFKNMQNLKVRWATADDADFVAETIRDVSEGVIDFLLDGALPLTTSTGLLKLIFGKGVEPYTYNHVLMVDVAGRPAGMIFAYDAKYQVVPAVMEGFLAKEKVDAVRHLLEAKRPDAMWVNTLWVHPDFRGQGLSSLIISLAADFARDTGFSSLALHCWKDNERAARFYAKQGFVMDGDIPTGGELLKRHPEGGACWVKRLNASSQVWQGSVPETI